MECTLSPDYDDVSYRLRQKIVTARKHHTCGECGCDIEPGMQYELYNGIQDGDIFTEKTCLHCLSIREAFFDQGVAQFGTVLDEVRENIIYELNGEVDSKCITPLTPLAKEVIFAWITEAWGMDDD